MVLPIITHGVGILMTPAIYFQFYMLAIPLLAVLTAGEWSRAWHYLRQSARGFWRGWIIAVTVVCWFTLGMFLLPRGPVSLAGFDLAAIVVIFLGLVVSIFRPRIAALILGIALVIPSVGRITLQHFFWPNRIQREDIELVDRLVLPSETILDGFTGMGCLRPHLNYWWWINEHTIPMMRATGEDSLVLNEVAQGKPAVILFDQNLHMLGGVENAKPVIIFRYPFRSGDLISFSCGAIF